MRIPGKLTTLWLALLCLPLNIFALGLGDIEVDSYLNQPLNATIEVVAARPGEVDDLLVSLASREAFRKAGLDRPGDLSKLRFKIEKSEDGQSAKILVTTKTAVKEPFLNFLIEADWAKGRLLREYTVLLDPPYFAQQDAQTEARAITDEPAAVQPAAVPEPIDEPTAAEPAQPTPIALGGSEAAGSEPESTGAIPYVDDSAYLTEEVAAEGEFVVAKGDTLWSIASRFQDGVHSMAQIMLAMQTTNPEAFGDDNINNLRVGSVLRAPDAETLDRLSKQEAYAQVLEQNGLWDEYVARKSGQPTAGSPMAAEGEVEVAVDDEEGQLSLLAPGEGDSDSSGIRADAEDADRLRKQLALAEEELEASRIENDDLRSRVTDLEAQIEKFEQLQRMVEIEDSSLAQLQQQADEQPDTTETMIEEETMVEEAPVAEETALVEEPEMAEVAEDGFAEKPSDVMVEAAEELAAQETIDAELPAEEGMMVEEEPESTEAETVLPTAPVDDGMMADETMSDEEVAQPAPPIAPAPAPVIVTETPDGGVLDMLPSLDGLMSDPIMLGGVGAILLLLIGLLLVKRRKASSEEGIKANEPESLLVDEDATPINVPSAEDVAADLETADDDLSGDTATMKVLPGETDETEAVSVEEDEEEFARTAVIQAEEMPEPEAPAEEEQDDVLNEADVYLAYGLYDNAEDLLKDSLQTSPDRADYRAKLLDTYFATKNAGEFVKEAEALKSLGGASDRYWDRVRVMGHELAPDNEMFAGAEESGLSVDDLEFAKPEAADFDIGAEDDITDFSSTDFDLGAEEDQDLLETRDVFETDNLADTQLLDEDLDLPDLDELDEESKESGDVADESAQLDSEIDLDFGEVLEDEADGLDVADDANIDDDSLNFDLPEDLDLGAEEIDDINPDDSLVELEDTQEAPIMDELPPMADDDSIELDLGGTSLDEATGETVVLDAAELGGGEAEAASDEAEQKPEGEAGEEDIGATQVIDALDEGTKHVEAALDLDMSDMESAELHTTEFGASLRPDDDITEFRPADVTGEFQAPALEEAEDAVELVDTEAGQEKTGTFAPGDFTDAELDEAGKAEGEDDISGLMLPDDVDEVGTKLDLAKAFIDMGDAEGARSSLEEVMAEGTVEQKAEATGLLEQIK